MVYLFEHFQRPFSHSRTRIARGPRSLLTPPIVPPHDMPTARLSFSARNTDSKSRRCLNPDLARCIEPSLMREPSLARTRAGIPPVLDARMGQRSRVRHRATSSPAQAAPSAPRPRKRKPVSPVRRTFQATKNQGTRRGLSVIIGPSGR